MMTPPSLYPYEIPFGQFRRRRNGLRRWSDRLELAVLLGAFALVPIAPVVAVTMGQHTLATAAAVSADRAASAHPTTAVLIQDAPTYVATDVGVLPTAQVPARWQAPDGSYRTGPVTADTTMRAGQTVPLWVDSTGEPTAAPASIDEQRTAAITAGTAAGLGWLALLASMVAAARWFLNRRRLRGWGDEWASVEQTWRHEVL